MEYQCYETRVDILVAGGKRSNGRCHARSSARCDRVVWRGRGTGLVEKALAAEWQVALLLVEAAADGASPWPRWRQPLAPAPTCGTYYVIVDGGLSAERVGAGLALCTWRSRQILQQMQYIYIYIYTVLF